MFLYSGVAVAHGSHAAYSCSGHCYGVNDWYGPSGSFLGGGRTDITVESMTCSSCDSGAEISNEMWIQDNTSSQRYSCNYSVCWVEVGYEATNASDNCVSGSWAQCYFWADNRPSGGYHFWPSQLPSDNYSHHTRFKVKIYDTTPGCGWTWYASINPLASSDGGSTNYSTCNTMYPQNELMGSELAGTTGVSVNTADFVNNQWANSSLNFYYQTNGGCESGYTNCSNASPPYDQWYSSPNCCNSGGDFQTWT